jgi:hypothetical protein
MAEVLRGIKGFEWDEGNSAKSEAKHGVTDRESEEIFFLLFGDLFRDINLDT